MYFCLKFPITFQLSLEPRLFSQESWPRPHLSCISWVFTVHHVVPFQTIFVLAKYQHKRVINVASWQTPWGSLSRCSDIYQLVFISRHSQWHFVHQQCAELVLPGLWCAGHHFSNSVLISIAWGAFRKPRPTTRPINSDSLGVGLRPRWFLEPPGNSNIQASWRTCSPVGYFSTSTCMGNTWGSC